MTSMGRWNFSARRKNELYLLAIALSAEAERAALSATYTESFKYITKGYTVGSGEEAEQVVYFFDLVREKFPNAEFVKIRKLMILLICCTILFTASSCTSSSNKIYDENSTENPSESSGADIYFDTYLYSTVEDNYILNEHRSTAFDTCEYTDAKVEQNKTLTPPLCMGSPI